MWGNTTVMLVGIVSMLFSVLKRAASPAVLETLCAIPVVIHNSQIWVCIGGAREAGVPREAGPWANTSQLGEGAWHRDADPGEQKCLHWSHRLWLCWEGADTHSLLSQKTNFCFELSTLSSPLKLQSSRQITRVIFLFFFLSPSSAGTVQRQLEDITDVQGGSSPGSALPCSTPALLPWGHWGGPAAPGTGAEQALL